MNSQDSTALYISPHLDDAVLSAGGLIARQIANGMRVVVATLVTADPVGLVLSPLAQRFQSAWGGGQRPFADRCIEDANAVGALGAEWRHFGLLDCIYRQAPTGRFCYDTMGKLFSGLQDPEDTAFVTNVSDIVSSLIDELRPKAIYTAATVGRHVDHVCVLSAVRAVTKRNVTPLMLWEDLPYATGLYPPDNPDTVTAALARLGLADAVPDLHEIDMSRKLAALRHYKSQIKELYGSVETMDRAMTDFALGLGKTGPCERFWKVHS